MMRPGTVVLALLISLGGCGGSGGAPAGTGGSSGGSGGMSGGASGGSGACPDRNLNTADSCSAFRNSATTIAGTIESGTAPTPMGGTIADGLYTATKLQLYGTASGDSGSRRTTIAVTDGGTQFLWVVEAAANGATSMGRLNTTVSTSGTNLNSTVTCLVGAVNLPATLGYTATATTLALQLTSGAMTTVTTYTRVGCPE